MKVHLILLLFSSIFFNGCFFDQPSCPSIEKQQKFPLQDYNISNISIKYWKEGDSNNTFIITSDKDFELLTTTITYYKESLKGLIININNYNKHIDENNKDQN